MADDVSAVLDVSSSLLMAAPVARSSERFSFGMEEDWTDSSPCSPATYEKAPCWAAGKGSTGPSSSPPPKSKHAVIVETVSYLY